VKRTHLFLCSACVVALSWLALPVGAQDLAPPAIKGQKLFMARCAACHVKAGARAPDQQTLLKLTPEAVYMALTTGAMRIQAQDLTPEQKTMIAEYLGGRPIINGPTGDATTMPNRCPANLSPGDPEEGPSWNGWSPDPENTRFQDSRAAGLSAEALPRLQLKWAFGFPNGIQAFSQPTVAAGHVFVGSDTSFIYSLDAATGCVYWSFQAEAGVRTAISVGPMKGAGEASYAAYFADQKGNVYAVNASTGELLWKTRVEEHPLAQITGAPKLYRDRLYVPVSAAEETISANIYYSCCKFRGSVVALDADTGRQVWKTYTILEKPRPVRKNSTGTQLWAPAGAAVWNSPTIDVKRRAIYIGTGDAYTEPAAKASDSVMALNLDTGKILWVFQDTRHDAWMDDCGPGVGTDNCPKDIGPDWDYSSSPILRALPNGRQIVVAAAKSGNVVALDPDRKGAKLWETQLAEKAPDARGLIVFGGTADPQAAYYALNQVGKLVAVDLVTGERRWTTPLDSPDIPGHPNLVGGSAAVTAIPGVLFAGGWDGVLRALSTANGQIIWQYNTAKEFTTVNGVAARGGSMGAPGPTVVGGMLFVGSGYVGNSSGLPGNVLLAFSAK